jgi:hypothetical protein
LGWGEGEPGSFPGTNDLGVGAGVGKNLSGLTHTPMVISRYPKFIWEEISSFFFS